jgi:DMSO/TMAO reductase YedYZ molybdopterin-dependent catalytic subunit
MLERKARNPFSSSRRSFFAVPSVLLLAGCDLVTGKRTKSILRGFQTFNNWVQESLFDPKKLAPEYSDDKVTDEDDFRVNGYDTDEPDIDIPGWTLTVDGLVRSPGDYTLKQISVLPKYNKNLRHICVEGWSMIPKWGGVMMKDFLALAGADLTAKYVSVECGDDYTTSWDMASVLHPQTLLAYEAYGKPLTLEHGAPLRVVMPVKLGYKSAKWISRLTVTNQKPGGYWEDQGYDWFAGV